MRGTKYIGYVALAMVLFLPPALGAQEKKAPVSEKESGRPTAERGRNSNIGVLHQRLAATMQLLKYPEGPITFIMGSGRFFDILEWRRFLYFSRAIITTNGGTIRSIEFLYIQYNTKSSVKETKSYILENPGGSEAVNVVVQYQLGAKKPTRYNLDEHPEGETRLRVVDQYRDRLFELVRCLEVLKANREQAKTDLVNRVVDLDQFIH